MNSIPVSIRAGEIVLKTVALPKQGTASGTIVGDVGGGSPENLPIGTTTKVTVTPLDGQKPVVVSVPSAVPGGPGGANSYSFGGAAGRYRIDVASVGFAPTSDIVVIANDANTPKDFTLSIIPGSIDLTVVRSLGKIPITPITAATYELYSGACSVPAPVPVKSGPVGSTANTDIGGLIPGAYCLQVREESGAVELAFPAIATIMVDRSTTPIPDTGAHVPVGDLVEVTAPLPTILPSVTGTVRAVSGTVSGAPVPLPDSVLLTIDYTGTSVQIDGTSTPNAEVLADGTDTVTRPSPTATSAQYEFTNVPAGSHVIKPQTGIAGYTPAATQLPFTVGTNGEAFGPTTGPDVVYVVSAVTVVVQLTPGDKFFFASAPTLTSPVNGVVYTAQPFNSTNNTLTFLNVASELGNFTLTISDPLHTYSPTSPVFAVPVITTPPLVQTVNLTPAATKGRVTGSLTQFNTNTSSGDMAGSAVITLTRTDTTQADLTFTTTGPTASYSFDAPAGSYDLSVRLAGFTEPVYPITITNGRQTDQDLRIDKLATITATILNPTVPASTTVVLVTNDTIVPERALARVGSTNVYTLQVVAGTYRYVEARSPGYIPVRNPSTSNPVLVLGIGGSTSPNFTLNPRTVTVNPINQSTSVAIPTATVSVTVGGVTPPAKTAAPYVFSSIDAGTAIPVSGTGTATVSAAGYRTRTAPIPDPSPTAITVALNPTVTVTGSITARSGAGPVPADRSSGPRTARPSSTERSADRNPAPTRSRADQRGERRRPHMDDQVRQAQGRDQRDDRPDRSSSRRPSALGGDPDHRGTEEHRRDVHRQQQPHRRRPGRRHGDRRRALGSDACSAGSIRSRPRLGCGHRRDQRAREHRHTGGRKGPGFVRAASRTPGHNRRDVHEPKSRELPAR